jgi:hypothetical protein
MAHGMSLTPYFSKALWKGKYPIWQDYDAWSSLGLPDFNASYQPSKVAVQNVVAKTAFNTDGTVKTTPSTTNEPQGSIAGKLLFGFLLGLLSYVLIINRQTLYAHSSNLIKKLTKK